MILITLDGSVLEKVLKLGFKASNNKREYKALLVGLRVAKKPYIK